MPLAPDWEPFVLNAAPGNRENGAVWFLGQMFMAPMRTFLYGMEILVDALRGVQHAGDRGIEAFAGRAVEPMRALTEATPPAPGTTAATVNLEKQAANGAAKTLTKEMKTMDRDLHDDMLKLVRYKILFVKREYEHAFTEEEDLVSDNMDGTAFTAWKAAEFIQRLQSSDSQVRVPGKWGSYPPEQYRSKGYLKGLPEEDKKYLRVYFEVLDRYPREKFKYEEQQIRVLEEIRDGIHKKAPASTGTGTTSGTAAAAPVTTPSTAPAAPPPATPQPKSRGD
jgi:hypothetical protein